MDNEYIKIAFIHLKFKHTRTWVFLSLLELLFNPVIYTVVDMLALWSGHNPDGFFFSLTLFLLPPQLYWYSWSMTRLLLVFLGSDLATLGRSCPSFN